MNKEEIIKKIDELEEKFKNKKKNASVYSRKYQEDMFNKIENVSSSEEMLNLIVNEYFLPIAKFAFEQNVGVKEAFLSVAQYWNDEADDAVHLAVQFSNKNFTSWEDLNSSDNAFDNNYDGPGDKLYNIAMKQVHNFGYGFYPDNHENFIMHMSEFCKPGSQEYDFVQNYEPLVIAFEHNGEVKVKIITDKVKLLQ